jgi:hypothetical protein
VKRFVPAVLAAALVAAAAWPAVQRWNARRAAAARLLVLEASAAGACGVFDPVLSVRVRGLGSMLAGWETVGGCGAGGGASVGTGVKWIGHGTTGGLFDVEQLGNYTLLTDGTSFRSGSIGYQYVASTRISKDLSDKWSAGLSLPFIYKYYHDPRQNGFDMSNGGLGDISALLTRKLGPINNTKLTAIVGFPTASYRATFFNSELLPDQQLGFGRVTGTVVLDQVFDQTWGVVVLGGAAGYRGGKNDAHNYRAPGGSVYGYSGWFLGPLVPVLGMTFTGYTQQDTRGDFGDTINAPVATLAGNASLEWSNDYVAFLIGAQFPYAVRGRNWGEGPGNFFGWQPWTVALGLTLSPF